MSLQSHIHLGLTVNGSPEFAPIYQWKVAFPNYDELPEVVLSIKRTSTGKLRVHTINDAYGPVQFMNYRMTLKLNSDNTYSARDYLSFLEFMNGKSVYFVDFDHPADGADHSAYVKTMLFQISRPKPMTPMLDFYFVDIELTDNHTVT